MGRQRGIATTTKTKNTQAERALNEREQTTKNRVHQHVKCVYGVVVCFFFFFVLIEIQQKCSHAYLPRAQKATQN